MMRNSIFKNIGKCVIEKLVYIYIYTYDEFKCVMRFEGGIAT